MKLYYAPGTSAVGIRVLLEEIGKPYQVVALNLRAGEQYQPPFVSINPKSKVPTLVRDDNSVLTEFGAIARWLARTNQEAGLLPADPEREARATELLDYVVGTVHMRGFSRDDRSDGFRIGSATRIYHRCRTKHRGKRF
jgi:glutathione S-transferase